MAPRAQADLDEVVQSAIGIEGIDSAAVFVLLNGASALALAAAAGIEGPPLDRLAEAVKNPDHPISRTIVDEAATFDAIPTAPGGPALRSHLPIFGVRDGRRSAVGVLAVAHNDRLDAEARASLEQLAASAQD
jgi:hypothetical protein